MRGRTSRCHSSRRKHTMTREPQAAPFKSETWYGTRSRKSRKTDAKVGRAIHGASAAVQCHLLNPTGRRSRKKAGGPLQPVTTSVVQQQVEPDPIT